MYTRYHVRIVSNDKNIIHEISVLKRIQCFLFELLKRINDHLLWYPDSHPINLICHRTCSVIKKIKTTEVVDLLIFTKQYSSIHRTQKCKIAPEVRNH